MRRLLSEASVSDVTGYHPAHVMRLVKEGKFPHPIKAGTTPHSHCRWDEADIEAWLAARKAEVMS